MPLTEQASHSSSLLLLSAHFAQEITPVHLRLGPYYRTLLQTTISSLTEQGAFLDVAIHFPLIGRCPRGATFDKAQEILFLLYSEISSLLHQEGKTDLIDVRIVFVYDDIGTYPTYLDSLSPNDQWPFGPVVSLNRLMKPGKKWDNITVAGTESSVQALKSTLSSLEIPQLQHNTEIFTKLDIKKDFPDITSEMETSVHPHIIAAVGGTFDHLHAGHKLLLTMAAFIIQPPRNYSPRLIIGLTGPELLKHKKYANLLSPWEIRAAETFAFLKKILIFDEENTKLDITNSPSIASTPQTPLTPATQTITLVWSKPGVASYSFVIEIVEINDPFGPTITNQDITVLVVSKETEPGGRLVNEKRKEKGWRELGIKVVDVISGGDEKMSSTEIRRRKAAISTT